LSWSSQNQALAPDKSMALAQLVPLLALDGIDYLDVQYGDTAAQRAELERGHGIKLLRAPEIDNAEDIDGLASLLAACDLLVTTSNVTAHLAGALGVETLLLAPCGSDRLWCWHELEGRSAWYPSVRIFRQHDPGDWTGPIDNMKRHLEARR
jgi:ADP-heptose:LPS heptosyltransferase